MTEAAERHSVTQIIIMTDAPRDNMSGIHDTMPLRGEHTNATQRAAVIVYTHNSAAKTLVTNNRLVLISFTGVFPDLFMKLFDQLLAVLISVLR